MSGLTDVCVRWLLRQPAVRRFVAESARQEVRDALQNPESGIRRGMMRVMRSEAKDLFQEQAESARSKIELSSEYERWARLEREAAQAKAYAQASTQALVDASKHGFIPGTALPNLAPTDDPLSSPWDSTHHPRCGVCSDPIHWSDNELSPAGGYWQHVRVPRPGPDGAGLHAATYAVADPEAPTQLLPKVES